MNANMYTIVQRILCVGFFTMCLTSRPMASKPIWATFDSVAIEALNVDWQASRATLRLTAYPGIQCTSLRIHLTDPINLVVLGDTTFEIDMKGQSTGELSFDVQFASNDTSAIHAVIYASAVEKDSIPEPIFGGGMFSFVNTGDKKVASQDNPWQIPANLEPQPRVARKQNPADEWAPPEGARFKARSDHELTMEELHEMEKTALDSSYFDQEEYADGKVWRRKGGEFLFKEKPNSEGVVEYFRKMNAEYEAKKAERMKKKKLSQAGGITFDSMLVLEKTSLENTDGQQIEVEGQIYWRSRGEREFTEAIQGPPPRGHRHYLLDLRDAKQFAIADTIVDSLFETRHAGYYWAWLDRTKQEQLTAAGVSFEPYKAPITMDMSKK